MNIYMYTYPRVKLLFFKKRCKNVEKDPTFFFLTIILRREMKICRIT